jgi:zinc/manganese transport system ATP-binding protein
MLPPLLELHDIRADHDGSPALAGVSLVVRPGELIAVAGTNGSGKSTLLGAIAGTLAVSAGSITRRRGASVGFVVQRSSVADTLPLTVAQTVAMGRWSGLRPLGRLDRQVIAENIGALGLQGLERRRLGSLSGGQRQRALVAQGLARRADLLVLDEPTVGLDDDALALIASAIGSEVARGAAVVLATHDPASLDSAHRVVRLENGRVTGVVRQ